MGKGKKGCLRRILELIGIVAIAICVFIFVFDFEDEEDFDDDDDYEYISEQERMAAEDEDDMSLDELVDMFFEWYGEVPDDDEKYNFRENKRYKGYRRDNYKKYGEHRHNRGNRREYWVKYWNDYYQDFGDYYKQKNKFHSYDDYENQIPSRMQDRRRRWQEYYDNEDNFNGRHRFNRKNITLAHPDDLDEDEEDYDEDEEEEDYDFDDDYDEDEEDYDDEYDEEEEDDEQEFVPSPSIPKKGRTQSPKITSLSGKDKRIRFVNCAKNYEGTPYVWGGTSHSGIDCSGLVYLAAKESGLGTLPRTAKTMHEIASNVSKTERTMGDLIFFSSGSSVSHVAIFLGNDQILHAVSDGAETGVIVSKLSEKYWTSHYYSSGRIIKD